ncbi:arylamine N-acetyltransferase [Nocardioides convexus]|uniref:arylamine N-acetyltransferase family protein n=1 Tax=Nocardioides convexus TaxID=2712224 RepID=UPI0031015372
MTDAWQTDRLDLDGYLARLGVTRSAPSRAALDALHEAHVRTFTFDNIDVLLDQHPGVGLDVLDEKLVGRGRGGYCFEHATVVAAALDRLGYDVRRHLGRVGDPAAGTVQGRTHMTVEVVLDGERLLCDPGFGMSLLRPVPLVDGAESDQDGWRYRVVRSEAGWGLERLREGGWELTHTTDEPARAARRRRHRPPLDEHLPRLALPQRPDGHPSPRRAPRLAHRHHRDRTTPGGTHRAPRACGTGSLAEWLVALGVPEPERAGSGRTLRLGPGVAVHRAVQTRPSARRGRARPVPRPRARRADSPGTSLSYL